MPRKKKDGRYINYYIDRGIYERLERYADDKGQPMTTAIERILKEHLDKYDEDSGRKGGNYMYCSNCNILVSGTKCPVCGSKNLREPCDGDYCFFAEKEAVWAGAMSDILNQNGIPFVTKNVLGAGLTARLGAASEIVRFYVPYGKYQEAKSLEHEFFSASADGEE